MRSSSDVTGITEIQAENSRTVVDGMLAGARAAHEAGVLVGVGTDTAMTFVTQYNTWRELALLVKYAGFTPAEAVRVKPPDECEDPQRIRHHRLAG